MRSLEKWWHVAETLSLPLPWDKPRWRNRGGDLVVLLHGLWRGWRTMDPLARHLTREGFSTLNIPYPSARLPIPQLVEHVRREITATGCEGPVHLVTHSLGGIIARSLLGAEVPWKCGRLIMLAPPNQGSEIVDWILRVPLSGLVLGPAGRALGRQGIPASLPPLPAGLEAAAVMGSRPSIPVFRRLLEAENDGIVSVSGGRIPGLQGFAVLETDHTFIPTHPEVMRLCPVFLRTGQWP
jgi:triacylglycerol lipase